MPIGPSSLPKILLHTLRTSLEGMVGAKSACKDAQAQLQMGHTGTGHTRDSVCSLVWWGESRVEIEHCPLSRNGIDVTQQYIRALREGTKTVG